jgi:hypothetical protein
MRVERSRSLPSVRRSVRSGFLSRAPVTVWAVTAWSLGGQGRSTHRYAGPASFWTAPSVVRSSSRVSCCGLGLRQALEEPFPSPPSVPWASAHPSPHNLPLPRLLDPLDLPRLPDRRPGELERLLFQRAQPPPRRAHPRMCSRGTSLIWKYRSFLAQMRKLHYCESASWRCSLTTNL